MKAFRHILTILVSSLFLLIPIESRGVSFGNENLHYRVMFKWGLINSQAGRATLSLRSSNGNYYSTLIAMSEPWADKIYRVRDTLTTVMTHQGLLAMRYEKRANEDGRYSKDIVTYSRAGNQVTGHCRRMYERKNRQVVHDNRTIKAVGTTVDMLSVFYYIRALDFSSMTPGHAFTINIFSGKRCEKLRLKFAGRTSVKIGKTAHEAYRIDFTFTTDGKTKSSDDMSAWISTDVRRIPLRVEGKLPVGKIQVFYTGG